jgi:hypothetical protein
MGWSHRHKIPRRHSMEVPARGSQFGMPFKSSSGTSNLEPIIRSTIRSRPFLARLVHGGGVGGRGAPFPRLFSSCADHSIMVHAAHVVDRIQGEWRIQFRDNVVSRKWWDNMWHTASASWHSWRWGVLDAGSLWCVLDAIDGRLLHILRMCGVLGYLQRSKSSYAINLGHAVI